MALHFHTVVKDSYDLEFTISHGAIDDQVSRLAHCASACSSLSTAVSKVVCSYSIPKLWPGNAPEHLGIRTQRGKRSR